MDWLNLYTHLVNVALQSKENVNLTQPFFIKFSTKKFVEFMYNTYEHLQSDWIKNVLRWILELISKLL